MIESSLLAWFSQLLSLDATTGQESTSLEFIEQSSWLTKQLQLTWQRQLISSERFNLYGYPPSSNSDQPGQAPRVLLCTHIDTVPPFLPPKLDQQTGIMRGRGSCDAKGQLFTMLLVAQQLIALNITDFGLLIVVGEEQDSCGAKLANQQTPPAEYLIVLEPTQNQLIAAAKGGLQYQLTLHGQAAHSGYPDAGRDAIQLWAQLNQCLLQQLWPYDHQLGNTTFNWGQLQSQNMANVISDQLTVQLNWRTTATSHEPLDAWLQYTIAQLQAKQALMPQTIELQLLTTRAPFYFKTLPGFKSAVVAFGCDAPYLTRLGQPLLYGPGDILIAHSDHEAIGLAEIETAVTELVQIVQQLMKSNS